MTPPQASKYPFFDLELTVFDSQSIVDWILEMVGTNAGSATILLPLNADCFNISRVNQKYCDVLKGDSGPIYPDGAGITLGSQFLGNPTQERIATTDLILLLLRRLQGSERTETVGFLGGARGIAMKAANNLNAKYPINAIKAIWEPPMIGLNDLDNVTSPWMKDVIEELNDTPVDILFVGFGCPKQELFCRAIAKRIPCKVLIPCGGLFSYYAGQHSRAPHWMQALGFEWLFRLALEPRRLWRRYFIGNTKFIFRLLAFKLGFIS